MYKCRACLSTEQKLVSFDDTGIESYNQLTGLNVKESDGLPQALCELCFNSMEAFVTFRLNCIHSEEILRAEYETSRRNQEVTNNLAKNSQSFEEIKLEVEAPLDDDHMETNSFTGADEESLITSGDAAQIKAEDDDIDDMDASMDCVICNRPLDDEKPSASVKKKGLQSLIKCSTLRKDGLVDLFAMVEEIQLHDKCRRNYVHLSRKGTPLTLWFNKPEIYEYDREPFDFNMKCFICSKPACPGQDYTTAKHKQIVYKIKNETTRGDIVKALKSDTTKKNLVILHRIENVNLIEVEARYHRLCYLQVMMPNQVIAEARQYTKKSLARPPPKPIRDLMTMDPKLLDNTSAFPFDTHCFFCATKIKSDENIKRLPSNKRFRHIYSTIQLDDTQEKIMRALETIGDEACHLILQRIKNIDLKTIAARCHKSCYKYYVYHNRLTAKPIGRPKSDYITDTMDIIYKHIAENRMNHFHVQDLRKLISYDSNIPNIKTIMCKLSQKYGDRITITRTRQKLSSYVTFHDLL